MNPSPPPSPHEPRLAPPGAGLPWPERWVAAAVFHGIRLLTRPARVTARLDRERAAIQALVQSLPVERAAQRVLIDRLPGLEDSSRFWSVFMTLDHLRIVNERCRLVIESLRAGRVPTQPARTADVKPSLDAGPDVIPAFERECDALRAAGLAPDLADSPARFDHPWFGPLDACGWHFMAAFHLGLHRRQIEAIQRHFDIET